MTIDQFLASLVGRDDAVEQIEGALKYVNDMPPEDRQRLVVAKLEFQKRRLGKR